MARLYPLDVCLSQARGILFDTTALLDLYQHERRLNQPSPLLLRVDPARRYMSVVNLFEFICNARGEEVRRRRAWLEDKNIRLLLLSGPISTTFHALIGDVVDCGLLADLLVAATAKVRELALASRDRDFERIDQILLVAEFAP